MEAVKETPTAEPKEDVKESREVRRMRERINEDANETFVRLADRLQAVLHGQQRQRGGCTGV